ncbi:TPA: response regulator [bacterium]|nr:response regulator [bacterium]
MLTFKDLLMAGPEAVCLVDSNMIILQTNQNMNLLLNYSDTNLHGQNLENIFFNNSPIQLLLKRKDYNQWHQGECILKTYSSLPLLVKFRAGQVFDEGSQTLLYVFVFREIEELQRVSFSFKTNAMKSLLKSVIDKDKKPEEILHDFFKSYDPDSEAFLLDLNLNSLEINENDRELLSSKQVILTSQIAINNRTPTLFHSYKLLCFLPVYSEKAVYGVCYIKFSISRLYDEEDKQIFNLCGKIVGSCIENNGICDQIYHLNPLSSIILDGIKQPVIIVNSKGLVIMINNSTKMVYGFTESEMLGRPLGDIIFPADSTYDYGDLINSVMQGKSIFDDNMTHIRSDLMAIDVGVTAYPYQYSDGKIVGVVFIMEDKSEYNRFKEKIEQWDKLSVLGELLHSAANELNNSLTSVIGHSEVLAQLENNDKVNEISSKIYKGAIRCGNVVKGLIDLARDDINQKDYTNIEDALECALDLKRYQLRANNIELYINLEKNMPRAIGNLHNIERLFLYIINYAEKRMLEYDNGGRLNINIKSNESNIIAQFADTGTCIATYDMETILSCDNINNDIDLIASCQLLKELGGSMKIDSKIGKMNIISIKLQAIGSIPIEFNGYNNNDEIIGTNKAGKKVLLVDDEIDIIDLLTDFLKERDYIVDIARDGNEAMEKVYNNKYDLIISDLKMPNGFTGIKLYGFIKRENSELAKHMIFMTGDIINKETQEFLKGIGNPYIEKPFLPESLMEIIMGMT